ncbi:MAG TPA: hypothetical protein VMW62_00915, partial [Chloroflexota bacterium]|nr:hypothetical protein [Chloroflexota bacterium]
TTLRLPDYLMDKLRTKSALEGRSLNDTAVDVLLQGLGEPAGQETWRSLRGLVERPPAGNVDLAEVRRLSVQLPPAAAAVIRELDRARQDSWS